ncbi:N-formylglutamate amidohydrolase [Mesorhizobium sp. SP-1A]|uniref:N-formylglutamate amidohydrolase n=1 Tax=Mesorhizobium sp. SP-1A TaxID=3077840 RepID=UPI0028F6EA7F|nr:N-formylglutamate amidohydrolase [Mesorhizobium sp. SP-1A]
MGEQRRPGHVEADSVRVTNPGGKGAYVLTCDHASNFLPPEYGTLGLPESELGRHIAWDPGALPVARRMAEMLDAVLIETCLSRLVLDCNRALDAPGLIPTVSETTRIPGNAALSAAEREARIARCWRPFHEVVDSVIRDRLAAGLETRLVSVHSFTPVYKDVGRPWHVGIIHDDDERLAAPLVAALKRSDGIVVGANEPYSPADGVYFTLEKHARSRGLPCAMIEIRNDEIGDVAGQAAWAGRLAVALAGIGKLAKPAGEAGPA